MNNKQNTSLVRTSRKIHRKLAVSSFLLFILISVTGVLLGWKKHSSDIILPHSFEGTSTNTGEWLSFDSLKTVAFNTLRDSIGLGLSTELERIDARPSKGMVKFVFLNHYWEVQLDAATAGVLSVAKRRSDFIENIHDGSILDYIFKTRDGFFKVIYTSILGLLLLSFTITGFWLWYGPRKIKKNKRKKV
ncbi:MAG: PepSY domain-containing protein [Bacteroidales bacterium]|nr:PepSY domain-containing protein [Bacteroidales bacterium]